LTETIKRFYKKLKEWISVDARLMSMIVEKQSDIKVNYMRRENLPDEVKPKEDPKASILGKRNRRDEDDGVEELIRDDFNNEVV
jgi:hypothetical protein